VHLLSRSSYFLLLWDPRFFVAFCKMRQVKHVLSQVNRVHSITLHFTLILVISSHLRRSLPIALLLSSFPTKALHAFHIPDRDPCPTHLILLGSSILSIINDEATLCSFYSCTFLPPSVIWCPDSQKVNFRHTERCTQKLKLF
jgi:hypothetical protein